MKKKMLHARSQTHGTKPDRWLGSSSEAVGVEAVAVHLLFAEISQAYLLIEGQVWRRSGGWSGHAALEAGEPLRKMQNRRQRGGRWNRCGTTRGIDMKQGWRAVLNPRAFVNVIIIVGAAGYG